MKQAIEILNEMESKGIISNYAVGGAIAAFNYIAPTATVDLDVFVAISSDSIVISLEPIFEHLRNLGFDEFVHEGIKVGAWPVQFLVPGSPLVEEALSEAVDISFDGEPTRIFSAEHLAAICLETGRPKDMIRLSQFVEESAIDKSRFEATLVRFGLCPKWKEFNEKFGG